MIDIVKKPKKVEWPILIATFLFSVGIPWGHVSGYAACFLGLIVFFTSLGRFEYDASVKRLFLFFIAFFIWGVIESFVIASQPAHSIKTVFSFASHWLFPFLLGFILPKRWRIKFVFLWMISVTLLAMSSLTAYLGWIDAARLSSEGLLKGMHTHIQLAALLLICLHLVLAGILTRGLSIRKTAILLFLGLFFAFCLVLTGSRGVWFAGAISIAGATIHNIVAGRRRLLAVIFVIVTLIAVVTAISLFPQVRKRIDRTGADDPSYIYRRNMATMAVIIIRDHPVAGIGPGEVPYAREYYELMDEMCLPVEIGYLRKKHLHNMYLHVTAEFGFVGFLLFMGIVVSVFIALARSAGSADDGLQKALIFGVIWAFVGVGVGDLLDCLLRGPPVAMEIFWLVGIATGSVFRIKEK